MSVEQAGAEPDVEPMGYTVDQAAAVLGVGARWLADAARGGDVPHRRLGASRRFTRADLQAILDARREGQQRPNPWGLSARSRSRLGAKR